MSQWYHYAPQSEVSPQNGSACRSSSGLALSLLLFYFSSVKQTSSSQNVQLMYIGAHLIDSGVDPTLFNSEILRTPEPICVVIPPVRQWRQQRERKQKWVKQARLWARLKANPYRPALLSLFLSNCRSLAKKMDEIRMRTMSHCVTIIMETWLNNNIPDAAIDMTGNSMKDSGKSRGGELCIYVNKWCTAVDMVDKHCYPDLELQAVRCRLFFLLREFSTIIIIAV